MAIRLRETYKCLGCGEVASLEEVLTVPRENQPAEPLPCKKCGKKDWEPVKQRR